jgi:hypothetical protein
MKFLPRYQLNTKAESKAAAAKKIERERERESGTINTRINSAIV